MAAVIGTASAPSGPTQSSNPVTQCIAVTSSDTDYISIDGTRAAVTRAIMVDTDGDYYFQFISQDELMEDPITLKAGVIYPFAVCVWGASSASGGWAFF